MSKSLQSSLSKERVGKLPNIVHRPQQSSGVELIPQNKENKNFETREHQRRSFENPAVNQETQFYTKDITNETVARKFVMSYNWAHRKDASEVDAWRREYQHSMETMNLCWKCENPIKARPSYVNRVALNEATIDDLFIEKDGQYLPKPIPAQTRKRMKRSLKINDFAKFEYTTFQYHTADRVANGTYADIPAHWEVKIGQDGKAFYKYIDGSNREIRRSWKTIEIRSRKRRFGKIRNTTKKRKIAIFVELKRINGELVSTEIIPNTKYRVLNRKCECRVR